jgi:hypothetical protein
MKKVLAYCAFLHRDEISLPERGVSGALVQCMAKGPLRLLWSQVEWPFTDSCLQRNAVEFHQVITHMFSQAAVIPFRLLSLFDDLPSITAFLVAQQSGFVADLERLRDLVQKRNPHFRSCRARKRREISFLGAGSAGPRAIGPADQWPLARG